MPYLVRKVGGLGFVLLGGLTAAHGGSRAQAWEVLVGLILTIVGAAFLTLKILRRNTAQAGRKQ